MLTQTIRAWGNSLGIRLPQAVVQQLGWRDGSTVTITTEGNKVILAPARPQYTLDELLENVTSEMQHDEMDWGEPVGEETW